MAVWAWRDESNLSMAERLAHLKATNIVSGREQRVWKMPPSSERAKARSKTFPGIALAMAEQWGTGIDNFDIK